MIIKSKFNLRLQLEKRVKRIKCRTVYRMSEERKYLAVEDWELNQYNFVMIYMNLHTYTHISFALDR